jgi:hypothetical protein
MSSRKKCVSHIVFDRFPIDHSRGSGVESAADRIIKDQLAWDVEAKFNKWVQL